MFLGSACPGGIPYRTVEPTAAALKPNGLASAGEAFQIREEPAVKRAKPENGLTNVKFL
jgi:hypothetical protein